MTTPSLALVLFATIATPRGFSGTADPELHIEGTLEVDQETRRVIFRGEMEVRGWTPDERCLYFPFNDPEYHPPLGPLSLYLNQKHLAISSYKKKQGASLSGESLQSETILRVPNNSAPLVRLKFVATQNISSNREFILDNFHPLPLRNCSLDPSSRYLSLDTNLNIQSPPLWVLAGPRKRQRGPFTVFGIKAAHLGIAGAVGWQESSVRVENTDISLYTFSEPAHRELMAKLAKVMASHSQWFGPFPFETLSIVETKGHYSHEAPALISLDQPRQSIFASLQSSLLNWHYRNLSSQLATQWYGIAIQTTPLDRWLVRGLVDFATLESLIKNSQRVNVFNTYDHDNDLISFSYLQLQEFTASARENPGLSSALTDTHMNSYANAPADLFVKHSLALRQLSSFAGRDTFSSWLRGFTKSHHGSVITPGDFASAISDDSFGVVRRAELAKQLRSWWTSPLWPDSSLVHFSKVQLNQTRWLAQVGVQQAHEMALPLSIRLSDQQGQNHIAQFMPESDSNAQSLTVITDFEPRGVEIDPHHLVFDANRFDNSNMWPSMHFFPGNAQTLSDQDYTAIWAPYAFRRPGEETSVGIQVALFRFLHSRFFARAETAPGSQAHGYEVRDEFDLPAGRLSAALSLKKNYLDEHRAEASLKRTPLTSYAPSVAAAFAVRHRRTLTDPLSNHITYAPSLSIEPSGESWCQMGANVEVEHAPESRSANFSFTRSQGKSNLECFKSSYASVTMSLFTGNLSTRGTPPASSYFLPNNAEEAALRIDRAELERSASLTAATVDLLLPLSLAIPDELLIISNSLRWNIFYDFGISPDGESRTYRTAGAGIALPFGGDISGVGALTLSKLSLQAVLYTSINGEASGRKAILFNFAGTL